MDVTYELLELVIRSLHRAAGANAEGSEEAETFMDAADALGDALDLLKTL